MEESFLQWEFESLGHLLSRPWFNRVWVLQEVAVARKALVQSGPATMPWETFATAAVVIYRAAVLSRSQRLLVGVDLSNVLQIAVLRGMVQKQKDGRLSGEQQHNLGMVQLAKRYRTWSASDPRDKLFALLGLASPGNIQIRPDYTRSVESVYQEFMESTLGAGLNLNALTVVTHRYCCDDTLPSWAPDWSDTTSRWDLMPDIDTTPFEIKEPSRKEHFNATFTSDIETNHSSLHNTLSTAVMCLPRSVHWGTRCKGRMKF